MITILGASGFIGTNLVNLLKTRDIPFYTPKRDEKIDGKPLGDVIYCIGMTADFRTKPFETVESHVCKLQQLLKTCRFSSLTYLSSTRLYLKSNSTKKRVTEKDNICLNVEDPFDIFAATKITGELLALNSGLPNVKIVRVSNVFGIDVNSENFITSIAKDAIRNGKVQIHTTPDSQKDYISIEDVCESLLRLASITETGVYNLSFGKNTTNQDIVDKISLLTGAKITYAPFAKKHSFKEIDNEKLGNTIGFFPRQAVLDTLPTIIRSFQRILL